MDVVRTRCYLFIVIFIYVVEKLLESQYSFVNLRNLHACWREEKEKKNKKNKRSYKEVEAV